MITKTIYISLVGVGVVFSFLSIIFFLLKGLRFFAVEEKETPRSQKKQVSNNKRDSVKDNVEQEIVAIMAALNEHETISGKDIIIRQK